MTRQIQVLCDSCGRKFIGMSIIPCITRIEPEAKETFQKDLCVDCFAIVSKLLYRSATPEDNFGATSDESIRVAISKMAERRKEVFERENKDV